MDQENSTRQEILSNLAKLRWYLTSLYWGGTEYWPAKTETSDGVQHGSCDLRKPLMRATTSADPEQILLNTQQELGDCTRCRLHTTRTRIVFGEGSPAARIVFVGEGPGYDEDQQGRPFVGRAGKLLDKMISALGYAREEVYICNMVKCRPPNNRTPNIEEIDVCSPFLIKQIEAIRPRVICALGACAAQNLLQLTSPISRLRGKIHPWRGIPFVATFHPAYLLRNPSQKSAAWQDLLEIQRLARS